MSPHNLYARVAAIARALPGKTALAADSGERFTYAELHAAAGQYANALRNAGLARGDRIVAQLDKSPQSLWLYLACLRSGIVYVPLNTAYQRAELEHFLGDADPRLVVCRPQSAALFAELTAAAARCPVLTLDEQGAGSLAEQAEGASPECDVIEAAADTLAVIIYTSGTTGRSKGAMLTHRNLSSNAAALVSAWGFSERDVLLHALPMFHVHGLFVANHCALTSGATLLWQRRFEAEAVAAALPQASVFMGVPTYYSRLLSMPELGRAQCAGLRLFVSGSAPLLAETHRAFESRTGHRILERYGMSEAGMIASNPLEGERRPGSVGLPLPGVSVRVADEADRPLPAGEIGGIQVRGDNVFAGYWRMPERTREEFSADGWFRTGDVGVFDGDGYLSIVGRAKDMIISGGYNVYPKEIEQALDELPGVAESAVIGIPHPDFGEAVAAAVVALPGVRLDPSALIVALRSRLANYKLPKRILVVDELPRNAMGKVQKAMLRDTLAGARRDD